MCIGIPVKVVEADGTKGLVELGGVKRKVDLRLVDGVEVGDYVILHAGFAIEKLDEEEALETLSLLSQVFSEDGT